MENRIRYLHFSISRCKGPRPRQWSACLAYDDALWILQTTSTRKLRGDFVTQSEQWKNDIKVMKHVSTEVEANFVWFMIHCNSLAAHSSFLLDVGSSHWKGSWLAHRAVGPPATASVTRRCLVEVHAFRTCYQRASPEVQAVTREFYYAVCHVSDIVIESSFIQVWKNHVGPPFHDFPR